jgi:hypothetical protein
MKPDGLQRRDFLLSGVAVSALAAGGSIIFGPGHASAMATSTLDQHTAETLMVMAHELFPHDRLGPQYYAAVVDAIDKDASKDAGLRQLLADGVVKLDAIRGIPWIQLSDGARTAALRSIATTEFFTTVRTKTIGALYGNPLVYQMFGYGGPSVQLGGYIHRGFDDIGWLPNG